MMTLVRLIRQLATVGAYASGVATVAFYLLGRPNRIPGVAFLAFAALALLLPKDDPDRPPEARR
jgi:hypothetical protein